MSDTLPNKYDDMTDGEIIKIRDKMMDNLVVVLNDGETYTSLSGCVILEVPQEVMDNDGDEIDSWIKDHSSEGKPIICANEQAKRLPKSILKKVFNEDLGGNQ